MFVPYLGRLGGLELVGGDISIGFTTYQRLFNSLRSNLRNGPCVQASVWVQELGDDRDISTTNHTHSCLNLCAHFLVMDEF